MGVPAFYGWLARRFPLIKQEIQRGKCPSIDYLYLDMNGIMYRCAKDDSTMFKDLITSQNYDLLFAMIFNYINQLVNIVGPKKFIFLSLDGSAPRAKMNQQRTRRFLSAKGYAKQIENLRSFGYETSEMVFENNSISPGTEFMFNLNKQLQFFIKAKMAEDSHWQNLEVVLSGSDVPGEGEHKILQYIRDSMKSEKFDPEGAHCIYGGDADLIMLGLSTHIKNFCLLREDMVFSKEVSVGAKREKAQDKYLLLYLNILREYFDLEFSVVKEKMKMKFELNRIIDDLILLFFFLGNDFLPRCYCFDIREGNIEALIEKYKEHIIQADSYLNNYGIINFHEMENLLKLMQEFEMKFIADRKNESDKTVKQMEQDMQKELFDQNEKLKSHKSDVGDEEEDILQNTVSNEQVPKKQNKAFFLIKEENEFLTKLVDAMHSDNETGLYKIYYYQNKLKIDLKDQTKLNENLQKLDSLMENYVQGLQFVGLYYYKGVPSWSWYYSNYYSPLASDLYQYLKHKNEKKDHSITFDLDKPFPPIKQLLSIMHPVNQKLLPENYRTLLTDPNSPLRVPVDYYPETFDVDPYGGLYEHEYICILPFIESDVIDKVYQERLGGLDLHSLEKNKEGCSFRYFYDPSQKKISVVSSIGSYYRDFEVCLRIEQFDVYEHAQDLELMFTEKDVREKCVYVRVQLGQMSRFPSLFSREIDYWELEEVRLAKLKSKVQKRMVIRLKEEFPVLKSPFSEIDHKWRWAYQGYPASSRCELVGWMSKEVLCVKKNAQISFLQGYQKEHHVELYETFFQLDYKRNGLDIRENQQIAFVRVYRDLRRKANGEIILNKEKFSEYFIPLQQMTDQCFVEMTPIENELSTLTQKRPPQDEFTKGGKAVLLANYKKGFQEKIPDGSLAFIQGIQNFNSEGNFQVEAQIIQKPSRINQKSEIFDNQNYRQALNYFTLSFIAQKLDLQPKVLLQLLDSIEILPDKEKPSGEKMTSTIDIGLNLISIRKNLIVPGFIRIYDAEEGAFGFTKYKQLENLEISDEISNYIVTFYNLIKNSQLLSLISTNVKAREKMRFTVKEVWRDSEDGNIELLKIYMWLLSEPYSKPKLQGLASEVYNSKKIKQIQEKGNIYQKNLDKVEISGDQSSNVLVDPNFIYLENRVLFVPVHFNDIPPYHQLGDRVVNLNTNGENSIPIGAYGTIVGILHSKYEVIFDTPFIGGDNLGWRCDILRGGIVDFEDVFNLNPMREWVLQLVKRDAINRNPGWDGVSKFFVPKFQDHPVGDDISFNQLKKQNKFSKNTFELFQQLEEARHQQKQVSQSNAVQREQVQKQKVQSEQRKPKKKNSADFDRDLQALIQSEKQENKKEKVAENEPENWEDEEDDYQKVKDGKEKKKGNEANKNLATKPQMDSYSGIVHQQQKEQQTVTWDQDSIQKQQKDMLYRKKDAPAKHKKQSFDQTSAHQKVQSTNTSNKNYVNQKNPIQAQPPSDKQQQQIWVKAQKTFQLSDVENLNQPPTQENSQNKIQQPPSTNQNKVLSLEEIEAEQNLKPQNPTQKKIFTLDEIEQANQQNEQSRQNEQNQ